MKPHARFLKALLPLIVVAVLLPGLAACKPPETELSFETIEQVNVPGSVKQWNNKESGLLIIASSQDVEGTSRFVTDEATIALQKLDFTTHFAVLAFRGLQGSSHSGFKIEQITRRGSEIVLYAQPGVQGPNPAESSPYQLVEIKKEVKWDADFDFSLYFDETATTAASTTHHVP